MRKGPLLMLALLIVGVLVAYNAGGPNRISFFSPRGVVRVADDASHPDQKTASNTARERKAQQGKAKSADSQGQAQQLAGRATVVVPAPETTALGATASEAGPPEPGAPESAVQQAGKARSPAPSLPFPTPEMLTSGLTPRQLRSQFGPPAIDIAGTREGRVLEKYYYVNRERNRLTIANLENGRLVSSESLSSPYFNLPSASRAGRE